MTDIYIERPKSTATINFGAWTARISSWLASYQAKSSGHQLDPYNEHLLRDAGISRFALTGVSASDHPKALNATRLHTPMGNNISLVDLYVHEHQRHR